MAAMIAVIFFALQVSAVSHAAQSGPDHDDIDCLVCIHTANHDIDQALMPTSVVDDFTPCVYAADYKIPVYDIRISCADSRAPPCRAPPHSFQN